MRTEFSPEQLAKPNIARANDVLRKCVHCGFCTATCPTYQVLGDELDSPRGRIYLIKDMLETGAAPDPQTVKHIDRCLSCLACMTTCPSGVHYMHLVDTARAYIEEQYQRPWSDRALRSLLAQILPYPGRFRAALALAKLVRPFRRLVPEPRLRAMLDMAKAPLAPPARHDDAQVHPAEGERRARVALMTGCAQKALDSNINAATIRLLTRAGCDVVIAKGAGCCGALTHHMGREADSHAKARANVAAWQAAAGSEGLDAIVINASGCGTTVKDYGHMLRQDDMAEAAADMSSKARDVTEVLDQLGLPPVTRDLSGLSIAYHAPCSLQHGQRVRRQPVALLEAAGATVREPTDAHLCCGSAGIYNLMQPKISAILQERKVATLSAVAPDVIATGNIGCMKQIAAAANVPVVHTVELLDWATGGPRPAKLSH